jgi:hypothetical protein
MSRQEQTPLLGDNGANGGGTYYFNNQTTEKQDSGYNQAVSDADGGQVVETLPPGASAQDFEPRAIGAVIKVRELLLVVLSSAVVVRVISLLPSTYLCSHCSSSSYRRKRVVLNLDFSESCLVRMDLKRLLLPRHPKKRWSSLDRLPSRSNPKCSLPMNERSWPGCTFPLYWPVRQLPFWPSLGKVPILASKFMA